MNRTEFIKELIGTILLTVCGGALLYATLVMFDDNSYYADASAEYRKD